ASLTCRSCRAPLAWQWATAATRNATGAGRSASAATSALSAPAARTAGRSSNPTPLAWWSGAIRPFARDTPKHNARCQQGRHCEHCQRSTVVAYAGLWRAIASTHGLEAVAALAGLTGAFLLATNGQHAAWGWWAFLASNVGWIAFGWIRRHWWLLVQQV